MLQVSLVYSITHQSIDFTLKAEWESHRVLLTFCFCFLFFYFTNNLHLTLSPSRLLQWNCRFGSGLFLLHPDTDFRTISQNIIYISNAHPTTKTNLMTVFKSPSFVDECIKFLTLWMTLDKHELNLDILIKYFVRLRTFLYHSCLKTLETAAVWDYNSLKKYLFTWIFIINDTKHFIYHYSTIKIKL